MTARRPPHPRRRPLTAGADRRMQVYDSAAMSVPVLELVLAPPPLLDDYQRETSC